MNKKRKAVIVAGKMIQDHEFIYPYYRLQEDGYEVDVAVKGRETVQGQIGVKVVGTKDFTDLKVTDYDMLVIPGGAKAMEYMRQDKDLLKFISDFHAAHRVIACICHGAQLLISAKVVKGKKIAGYYSIRDDIENAGAQYTDMPAVVDNMIVTTAHYKDLGPWMKAALNLAEQNLR